MGSFRYEPRLHHEITVSYTHLDVYKRQCVTYILNYVKNSGCNGFTDGEIFGQAIHYYEENEIEVGKPMNCQVAVNHIVELTAEEKAEARQKAIQKYQDEEVRKLQNRNRPAAKKETIVQPSLFDF